MDIDIVDRRPKGRQLAQALRWRLKQALARLEGPVQRVTLTLADINGPRGGVDQRCQLVIGLEGGAPLVIQAEAESVQQATGNAIARARRNLARRVKKRQQRRRQGPPKGDRSFRGCQRNPA